MSEMFHVGCYSISAVAAAVVPSVSSQKVGGTQGILYCCCLTLTYLFNLCRGASTVAHSVVPCSACWRTFAGSPSASHQSKSTPAPPEPEVFSERRLTDVAAFFSSPWEPSACLLLTRVSDAGGTRRSSLMR